MSFSNVLKAFLPKENFFSSWVWPPSHVDNGMPTPLGIGMVIFSMHSFEFGFQKYPMFLRFNRSFQESQEKVLIQTEHAEMLHMTRINSKIQDLAKALVA